MKVKEVIEVLSKLPEDKEVAIATYDVDMCNEYYSTFNKVEAVIPKMPKRVANNLMPFDKKYADCVIISTHKKLETH